MKFSKKRPASGTSGAAGAPFRSSEQTRSASPVDVEVLPPPQIQAPTAWPSLPALDAEWLETDGLGGFASGTVSGIRTRREHALLLVDGIVLVNGFDTRVMTPKGMVDINSHHYAPDVVHPDGHKRLESFTTDPWPTWVFRLDDGTRIAQQIFSVHGVPGVIVCWSVVAGVANGVRLMARPLISGREAHALHHENPHFRSEASCCDSTVRWQPYATQPVIVAGSNGSYAHHHMWYHRFLYGEDRARGLDHIEDLGSPGIFEFDLSRHEAVLVLTTEQGFRALQSVTSSRTQGLPGFLGPEANDPSRALEELRDMERASRGDFQNPLHHAADAYVVRRGDDIDIVTGYPAAEPNEAATFAAIRGLCLSTDRLEEARQLLLARTRPRTVEGTLWFVIVASELIQRVSTRRRIAAAERKALQSATVAILAEFIDGSRERGHMDEDGLFFTGAPGSPRAGKAVDVQALWLNALRAGAEILPQWRELCERGLASFERRFWNEESSQLHDVVDANHVRGAVDPTFRAHQLWALGGLPVALMEGDRARRIVGEAEARLLTPVGLRVEESDAVAWPRLMTPFVDAWLRTRGPGEAVQEPARADGRERFLRPLLALLGDGSLGVLGGHIPECLEVEPPHTRRGTAFCAWSVGEALRLWELLRT